MTNDILALETALYALNPTNTSSSGGVPLPTPVVPLPTPNPYINNRYDINVGDWSLADIEYIDGGYVRGRAEYYNQSLQSWGTVCDDGFTYQNAKVFCSSIGLPSTNSFWASLA